MTFYIIGFIAVFLLILASGFPVGFGLGFFAIGLITVYLGVDMGLTMSIGKAYHALDSSILVAIPLFIFAAQLIAATGMGKQLFDAAKAFLGKAKAGLGIGTILSSGLFAAMTGSSFVSASTMGLIAIPELKKAKYKDSLIAATITAGGSLGSVIPPSIVMILYGYLTDESIGKLFMAGMIPGLLLIMLYSIGLVVLVGRGKPAVTKSKVMASVSGTDTLSEAQIDTSDETMKSKPEALKAAFWGIMAPVIILGGIYLGIFTASEAAAVAVVYCILVGFFISRTLSFKKLFEVMMQSASVSAMVAMIVVGGAMMGHVIVLGKIPQTMLEVIIAKDLSPILLLIVINIILFILGMFMEVLALVYLTVPLLYPVILHLQWDNIWFAVILLINVNLALITPPMGGVLYIVSQIGNIPIQKVIKGAIFPISILLLVLLLVILFPPIATWLPSML